MNSGVFLSTLLHLPYPDRGVVRHSVQSVFTRLFTSLIACLSSTGHVHCMLRLSAHHRRMDCLFPLVGMRIGLQGRPESPFTCSYIWSSLDQYRITYSSV